MYLPSLVMRERWKQTADNKEMTLSKFVVESVENQIKENEQVQTRSDLLKKIDVLEAENVELRRKKNQLNIVIDKLNEDLRIYRMKPFLEEGFTGVRKIEQRLVNLLKSKKSVNADEIHREIGINPRDSDAMKAIGKQLQQLEAYGLVEKTYEGWAWIR